MKSSPSSPVPVEVPNLEKKALYLKNEVNTNGYFDIDNRTFIRWHISFVPRVDRIFHLSDRQKIKPCEKINGPAQPFHLPWINWRDCGRHDDDINNARTL